MCDSDIVGVFREVRFVEDGIDGTDALSAFWIFVECGLQAISLRYKAKLRDAHLDDSLALSRGVAVPESCFAGKGAQARRS